MSDSQSCQIFSNLFQANPTTPLPSILVVTAHPDDEVVGVGAWLPRWKGASFLHVTDGAPLDMKDARESGFSNREEYAQARRQEFCAALELMKISAARQIRLDFIDQETALHLPEIATRLQRVFSELQPEVVITHPYEGGHPDHDSTAWAVAAACQRLREEGQRIPLLVEMTSYHNGTYGMVAGQFLPDGQSPTYRHELSAPECLFKRRLFACYKTQQRTLRWFPMEAEAYRIAPRYDFSRPPHEGKLFYEQFKWGMEGARWRMLAARAFQEFQLNPVA